VARLAGANGIDGESAGIASYGSDGIHVHKGMGLVSQVFDEPDILALTGKQAIGHTRYSTSGGSKLAGIWPWPNSVFTCGAASCRVAASAWDRPV
jgi:glutamine phosphoribosylpyrophosphate amidotransferase